MEVPNLLPGIEVDMSNVTDIRITKAHCDRSCSVCLEEFIENSVVKEMTCKVKILIKTSD